MKKKILLFLTLTFFQLAYNQGAGCPQVFTSQDQILPCTQSCTNISASVFDVGETTSYNVNSIPHSPPIAYNAPGGTSVSVGTDDVWSPIITLPFPFCYFGQTYTTCKVGSNGGVTFAPASAGGYNPYLFSASIPSPALSGAGDVFGPYHDIDPSVAGDVKYFIQGNTPCRKLIVVFNELAHYNCTSLRSTHMMVFYETTNIIEVFVQKKETCNGWNNGNTVIGIQNPAGTVGYTPPVRNTGSWSINSPEAWEFKPSGSPIYSTIEWLENSLVIGSGNTINICPTAPSTTYTARTTYTRCDGLEITAEDNIEVAFAPNPLVLINPFNLFTCSGQTTSLIAQSLNTVDYLWSPGGSTASSIDVSPSSSTSYTVTVTDVTTGCTAQAISTVTIAEPVGNSCNVLYVTPTALPSGSGTKASPIDLSSALEIGACNGTTIKMAIGNYLTDTAITGITSYLTLEGGFDDAVNWEKVSTVGATKILRTATMSTSMTTGSTSIIYGVGIQNESGPDPKIVAIDISNQIGFRFQDITIETEGFAGQSSIQTYQGVSTYGVQLTACSDYNFIRTNIQSGSPSNGYDEFWGFPSTNGGSSYGINAVTNGSNGNIINSTISAGPFGNGGTGVTNGVNGISSNVTITGTALVIQDDNFNLAGQSSIRMQDISCTNTAVDFSSSASGSWTFGANSLPSSLIGSNVNTLYSTIGRKDISFGTDLYTGFSNILLDDQIIPNFTTNAQIIQGQYRVCAGDFLGFTATNGGIGYLYEWDLGGAAIPNTYSGTTFNSLGAVFNTPGIYTVSLNYVTNCCGASVPATIDIYVEENPLIGLPGDVSLCLGENTSTALTVTGLTTEGTVNWSPPIGLDRIDSTTVIALPLTSTTYLVTLIDSSGICTSSDSTTVSVVDLLLDTTTTSANCSVLGTASVIVLPSLGASGNYSYAWSNGDNAQTITSLQPDFYSVVVTDNVLGCTDSITANVTPGPGALLGFVNSYETSCFGIIDGKIVVTIQGGISPYTYTWSNGVTNSNTSSLTDSIENLSSGNYDLLITDFMGCIFNISTQVEEPNQIVFSLDSIKHPTCVGIDDGFIAIRPDGGVIPYSFVWTNTMPINVVFTDVVAINLTSENYTLILTDFSGCQDSVSVQLTAPLISTSINDTICDGGSYLTPSGILITPAVDTITIDTLTSFIGCDSVVIINLKVNSSFNNPLNVVSICEGINYVLPSGNIVSIAGTYLDTLNTINGCDSILTTQVIVDSFQNIIIVDTVCQGGNILVNGETYTAAGNYLDTALYMVSGCDSIHYNITLQEDGFQNVIIVDTICQGGNILVNGETYTAAGNYLDTAFYMASGCDSIHYDITLQVNATYNTNKNISICEDALPYVFLDGSIHNSNTAVVHINTLNSINNCDSIITTNLIINKLGIIGSIPDSVIICESFNQILTMSSQNMTSFQWKLDNGAGFTNIINGGIYSGANSNELSVSPLDTLLTGNLYKIIMFDECGNGPFMDVTYLKVSAPHDLNNPIEDVERCLDENSLITVDYNGYNYVWDNGQTGQYLQATESGTYSVSFLEKGTNCILSDEFNVRIEDCIANCIVTAPTGFSPNSSTKNDEFKVITSCDEGFSFFEFRIYNRWGEEIFFTDNPTKGWDGSYKNSNVEIGLYTYVVEYIKNLKTDKVLLTGNITLIR